MMSLAIMPLMIISLAMLQLLYDVIDNNSFHIISLAALYYDTDDMYQ